MTPTLHDSQDWRDRDIQATLRQIEATLSSLRIEFEILKSDQKNNHHANVEKIDNAEKEMQKLDLLINGDQHTPGLRADVSNLMAYGRASVFWAKAIAGLLTVIFLGGSLYVAWFEAHRKVTQNSPVSILYNSPENSG